MLITYNLLHLFSEGRVITREMCSVWVAVEDKSNEHIELESTNPEPCYELKWEVEAVVVIEDIGVCGTAFIAGKDIVKDWI